MRDAPTYPQSHLVVKLIIYSRRIKNQYNTATPLIWLAHWISDDKVDRPDKNDSASTLYLRLERWDVSEIIML